MTTEPKPLTDAQKHVLSAICVASTPVLSGFRTMVDGRIVRRDTMRALFRSGMVVVKNCRFTPTPAGRIVGERKSAA